jgi:hypothetical protein
LDATPEEIKLAVSVISAIRDGMQKLPQKSTSPLRFTLRTICRFLDSAYNLPLDHKELASFSSVLWAAYEITIQSQFSCDHSSLDREVSMKLFPVKGTPTERISHKKTLEKGEDTHDHVFSKSRTAYAGRLLKFMLHCYTTF